MPRQFTQQQSYGSRPSPRLALSRSELLEFGSRSANTLSEPRGGQRGDSTCTCKDYTIFTAIPPMHEERMEARLVPDKYRLSVIIDFRLIIHAVHCGFGSVLN